MKKTAGFKVIAVAVIILLVPILSFFSCADKGPLINPGTKESTVFVASDLHLFSNNLLSPDNKVYVKSAFSSDGRIQECDYELVSALVDEVNEQKADYLILTGDLAFNGEKDSHLELVKLLEAAKETKILVIPGNHDIYSLSCVSAKEDKTEPTDSIDSEEFRQIYSDFGYSGAYSYDGHSLSYIYEIGNNTWALMLDTSQSKYNEDYGYNVVGGYIEEPTMLWLKENLKYAKEHGISVLSFSHHNLLVHNELFESNYTLYNNAALLELFAKYGVKLNFSGHLHIQSIKSENVNEHDIYDISSNSLLDYGNRYGRLDIYDNCYSYQSCSLSFHEAESLREYSFKVFCDEYYSKTVGQYQNTMGDKKGEEATRLLSEINSHYFDGSYEEIHDLIKENKRLIKLIKKNTPNYDTSYAKTIIEVPKEDQHSLLIERSTQTVP